MESLLLSAMLTLLPPEMRAELVQRPLLVASLAAFPTSSMDAAWSPRFAARITKGKDDSVINGVVLGAVIGAGVNTAASIALSEYYFGEVHFGAKVLPAMALGAAGGALIGYVIDRLR